MNALSSVPSVSELLHPDRRALAALMRSEALNRGDVTSALEQLTETAASTLGVERASVWLFNKEHTRLELLDLFERGLRRHSKGVVLEGAATPRYFAALAQERSIPAHDAATDPRTSEFADSYLKPLGITSMLDAPILLQGKLIGVVCHEHVGPARQWQGWEELVGATFADFVSMAMGAATLKKQSLELDHYHTHLEQLVDQRTLLLRESETSFRRIFEISPVAFVLTDLQTGTVLSINQRASELLGVPADEAKGRLASEFWVHPEDRGRLVAPIQAGEAAELVGAELRSARGTTFFADIHAEPLMYEHRPCVLMGVRDVTRQRQAELLMRQSWQNFSVLFDAAPVPLVLMRLDDALVRYCNQRAASMFGTTVAQVVGKRSPDFYAQPDDRDAFLRRLREDGRVEGFAVKLRTQAGDTFWSLLNANTLQVEGEQVFMLGFQDLTEQKAIEERLLVLATTDALTGAFNRGHFLGQAQAAFEPAASVEGPQCLAMLDADHFKTINDRFGHAVGDEALRSLAEAVRAHLRPGDLFGRYGGEELTVLLPGVDLAAAQQVMERVRRQVASAQLTSAQGPVQFTVSVGVVQRQPREGLDAVLKRADLALYKAKQAGRNRVERGE